MPATIEMPVRATDPHFVARAQRVAETTAAPVAPRSHLTGRYAPVPYLHGRFEPVRYLSGRATLLG